MSHDRDDAADQLVCSSDWSTQQSRDSACGPIFLSDRSITTLDVMHRSIDFVLVDEIVDKKKKKS